MRLDNNNKREKTKVKARSAEREKIRERDDQKRSWHRSIVMEWDVMEGEEEDGEEDGIKMKTTK